MTTDTLIVKSLFQAESGIRPMAGRAADAFFSFFQGTFIQDVFPIFIEMVTVLAGESGFGMTIVRKGDRRSRLSLKDL